MSGGFLAWKTWREGKYLNISSLRRRIMNKILFCFLIIAFFSTASIAEEDYYIFFYSCRDNIVVSEDRLDYDTRWGFRSNKYNYSEKCEIYRMNQDGGEQVRLTDNRDIEQSLALTDDRVAYVIFDMDDKNILTMDYDGNNEEYLCEDIEKHESDFTFNSDYDKMIYTELDADSAIPFQARYSEKELYMLDLNTMEKTRLTNNDEQDCCPAFFTGENVIAFGRVHKKIAGKSRTYNARTNRGGMLVNDDGSARFFGIFTLDLDTMEEKHITNDGFNYSSPVVSPNGKYIATAYVVDDDRKDFALFDRNGIKLFNMSGMQPKGECDKYKFMGDSRVVGVLCSRDFQSQLYIVDIDDGFSRYSLIPNDYYVGSFDFSPDFKYIIFSAVIGRLEDRSQWEIYKINIDNEEITRLTDNNTSDNSPVVLPVHYTD